MIEPTIFVMYAYSISTPNIFGLMVVSRIYMFFRFISFNIAFWGPTRVPHFVTYPHIYNTVIHTYISIHYEVTYSSGVPIKSIETVELKNG